MSTYYVHNTELSAIKEIKIDRIHDVSSHGVYNLAGRNK